jgi:hypothetical protein
MQVEIQVCLIKIVEYRLNHDKSKINSTLEIYAENNTTIVKTGTKNKTLL